MARALTTAVFAGAGIGLGYYLSEQKNVLLGESEVPYETKLENVIIELFDKNIFKFGEFTLKSGITSPIYIDLRSIVAYPKLLLDVSDLMWHLIKDLKFHNLCGVPYTALPIATCMCTKHNVPMLMKRKEAKKYGTKKQIEGVFQKGETSLIVEDLVTSGMSVFETVAPLQDVGLEVTDVVVLVDRQQGGRQNIEKRGLNLHAAITITNVLDILRKTGRITDEIVEKTQTFLRENQVVVKENKSRNIPPMTYTQRAPHSRNPVAQRLFRLMDEKKTNLCVSADLAEAAKVLELAQRVGPHICMLKTHVDIMADFTPEFVDKLKEVATRHNFMIFEDRKFADIGNTVLHQYTGGLYKISEWADITDAHPVPGPGIIQGLEKGAEGRERGVLLLAELSSKGSLANGSYTEACVKMAESNTAFCAGFICQRKLSDNPGLLHFTPGVNLSSKGDKLGQRYRTPQTVIEGDGVDGIIVGRGIYKAEDPAAAAAKYRQAGWEAYTARIEDP